MIDDIFNALVDELEIILPEFGKNKKDTEYGRRDTDANWEVKEYKGKHKDGTAWSKIINCFGYKLHLIVDADYELPVAFNLTKASTSEIKKSGDSSNHF